MDAIYQHPLAYILGLEGGALFRAFAGQYDRDFTLARFAEIRSLLDRADQLGEGYVAERVTTAEGYASWAPYYDTQANAMIEREGPIVATMLDRITAGNGTGVVLDAACGTGRHMAYAASLGHRVIGVDSAPAMLAIARQKVPQGDFHESELHRIPLPDKHADVVVCALALTHVPDLHPVFAEFARVLRPGGHLIISDSRGSYPSGRTYPIVVTRHDGSAGYIPCWVHTTSDYLKAALPLGLQVRGCEEPSSPHPLVDATGTPPGDQEPIAPYVVGSGSRPSIWDLHPWAPEATNASYRDKPHFLVLHFQSAG